MKLSIKASRVNAGLTIRQASELLGVTPATISNWELGKRDPLASSFLKMCEVYGVNPDDIFLPQCHQKCTKLKANATKGVTE